MSVIKGAPLKFGQFVPDEGIFFGACKLSVQAENPRNLLRTSQLYVVFSASQDLTTEKDDGQFLGLVEEIGKLNLWGHQGAAIDNERALFEGLENGKLVGLWALPPLQVLCGYDSAGNYVQPNNMFRFRNFGALAGAVACDPRLPYTIYMSCSTYGAAKTDAAWMPKRYCRTVDMSSGERINLPAETAYMRPEQKKRCRVFRFVPASKFLKREL